MGRLGEAMALEALYLFDPHACKTADARSNLDLLVVAHTSPFPWTLTPKKGQGVLASRRERRGACTGSPSRTRTQGRGRRPNPSALRGL